MVKTYRELLAYGEERLAEIGADEAKICSAELLSELAGFDLRSILFRDKLCETVSDEIISQFEQLIERRLSGEPLQYILGEWEFFGMPFKVGKGVLIPRQDTETLVELAIKLLKGRKDIVFADLCSGSGCIAAAAGKNLDCKKIYCVERSAEALAYLKKNLAINKVDAEVIKGDVLEKQTAEKICGADIITCNPPYLTAQDMNVLQKEVTFEPKEALFGGSDGLDFYREITRLWKDRLKKGGILLYEIGIGQENDVMEIMLSNGFEDVKCQRDLCGVNRCVYGIKC